MEPINFEGVNTQMGKGQPQYNIVPVQMVEITPAEVCYCCKGSGLDSVNFPCDVCNGLGHTKPAWNEYRCRYQLNEMEIAQLLKNKCFYISQEGYGFNPILPLCEDVKNVILIDYQITDGIVEAWIPMADKTEMHTVAPDPLSMVELICSAYDLLPENLGFRLRYTTFVNEKGELE
jgi:hypothetical protein